ncbi:hypothetical protein [Pseudomonas sp.]|uniref:hypothetical protein n=1 Tax=Pseudomonas sp. TaxID=306 RepID=UPI00258C16CA|nr:hypothetical protein [Pseudomonas sp.]
MDHFGIRQAMKGVARCHFQASRGTEPTTYLLQSLKDGDRVSCVSSKEAERVTRMFRERKVGAQVIAIDPDMPERISERGTPKGRTIFDESWIEQYYIHVLEAAAKEIDRFQPEASGIGAAHVETREAGREAGRWFHRAAIQANTPLMQQYGPGQHASQSLRGSR